MSQLDKITAVARTFDDAAMAATNASSAASTPMSATAPKPPTLPQTGMNDFKAAVQRGVLKP